MLTSTVWPGLKILSVPGMVDSPVYTPDDERLLSVGVEMNDDLNDIGVSMTRLQIHVK